MNEETNNRKYTYVKMPEPKMEWNEVFEEYSKQHPLNLEQVRSWYIPFKEWCEKNYSNGDKQLLSDAGFIMRDISLGVHSEDLNFKISKWMDDFYKLKEHATEKPVSVKTKEGEDELIRRFEYYFNLNCMVTGEDWCEILSSQCATIAKQYSNQKLAELEKWIDENEEATDFNHVYVPELKEKIRSFQ